MRTPLIAFLLACLVGSTGEAQQPRFPSQVELVTIDAVVLDRLGNPVEGLSQNDFEIREDGHVEPVAAFESVAVRNRVDAADSMSRISTNRTPQDSGGQWFFVLFDDANISRLNSDRARETLVHFIERSLRPGDRVMISSTAGGTNWVGDIPDGRKDLIAFAQRLQGNRIVETGARRIWDYEAMGIALGRDRQVEAQVARRLFENGVVSEVSFGSPEAAENFGGRSPGAVAPGLESVRILARQTYAEARGRLQISLGTLERTIDALTEGRGRKTLLLLSEGFVMDTTLENFRTVLRAAQNANVAVHFVDVSGANSAATLPLGAAADIGQPGDDRDVLQTMGLAQRESEGARSLALDTGGSTVSGTDLLSGLNRLANQARAYYLLGYIPTNSRRDGRFRKIEVAIKNRPDVTIRARGGYFAPSDDRNTTRGSAENLNPRVRAALDSPFAVAGIPLRLTSYFGAPQGDGQVQTRLIAEVDPSTLRLEPKDGRTSAVLESYVLVRNARGEATQRDERLVEFDVPSEVYAQLARNGLRLQRELALEPGAYQVTFVVRDRATGSVGSIRHAFDVPPATGFRISTPIVTNVLQAAGAGAAPQAVPLAHRTFTSGARLFVALEVFGARQAQGLPQVSVAYALKRSDGNVLAASPPQRLKPTAEGGLPVTIGVTLPPDASGNYNIELSVRDELAGAALEHVEPVTITAP